MLKITKKRVLAFLIAILVFLPGCPGLFEPDIEYVIRVETEYWDPIYKVQYKLSDTADDWTDAELEDGNDNFITYIEYDPEGYNNWAYFFIYESGTYDFQFLDVDGWPITYIDECAVEYDSTYLIYYLGILMTGEVEWGTISY